MEKKYSFVSPVLKNDERLKFKVETIRLVLDVSPKHGLRKWKAIEVAINPFWKEGGYAEAGASGTRWFYRWGDKWIALLACDGIPLDRLTTADIERAGATRRIINRTKVKRGRPPKNRYG